MKSPAPDEEQAHAPVHAGGCPAGKQLFRKESGGPGEYKVERAGSVHLWQRPTAWWAALGGMLPVV